MGKPNDNDLNSAQAGDRASALIEAARAAGGRGPAPVHLWNPAFCGEIDIEIRADGTWFHEGSPIGRPELVRLFSTLLKYENGAHYLVTPGEKLAIRVEDAPFVAVDAEPGAEGIAFVTNLGEAVRAGPDHPITLRGSAEAPRPYIEIRHGLMARIDRKTFYRLAELATPGPDGRLGVISGGAFFSLEP